MPDSTVGRSSRVCYLYPLVCKGVRSIRPHSRTSSARLFSGQRQTEAIKLPQATCMSTVWTAWGSFLLGFRGLFHLLDRNGRIEKARFYSNRAWGYPIVQESERRLFLVGLLDFLLLFQGNLLYTHLRHAINGIAFGPSAGIHQLLQAFRASHHVSVGNRTGFDFETFVDGHEIDFQSFRVVERESLGTKSRFLNTFC